MQRWKGRYRCSK